VIFSPKTFRELNTAQKEAHIHMSLTFIMYVLQLTCHIELIDDAFFFEKEGPVKKELGMHALLTYTVYFNFLA
jgi:hypothetical protein